jgi:nitrate reductase gamma subunit
MPARDTFWNISATGESLFYLLGYAALLVCALLIAIRIRRYFHGRRRLDTTGLAQRLTQLAVYGLGQRKVMNKTASGMAHVLIFAGMAVLFIGTLLVAVDYDLGWNILRGHFYLVYEAFLDAFGLCFVAGLVCALCRRRALGRHPLEISWQDRLLLLLLLAIGLSAFVVEGLRLAATHPPHAPWSFAGYGLARLFDATAFSVDGLRQLHLVFWWLHAVLALTLLVLIPMTKLFHLIAAPLQIFFRPLEARSALTTPFDVVNRLEAEMAADP